MANDFIKIDRTTSTATHAQVLLQAVNALRIAVQQVDSIRSIMTHNHDGSSFANLEALFGVPTGQGQAVFTLFDGASGSFRGTFQVDAVIGLIERVG